MYSHIINPKTKKQVAIKSSMGKKILRNYLFILSGGSLQDMRQGVMKNVSTYLTSDDKHQLEQASGHLALSHRGATHVKINLDCADDEWEGFKRKMIGLSATVIFTWSVPITTDDSIQLPHIDRLCEFSSCELHIDTSRKINWGPGGQETQIPNMIIFNDIGRCKGLKKIIHSPVFSMHSYQKLLLPTLIFDDSVLEIKDQLILSERHKFLDITSPTHYSFTNKVIKMNPEFLYHNSPEVLSWIINQQMGGTLKIDEENIFLFTKGPEIEHDSPGKPNFDYNLTKILRIIHDVLQAGPCEIIINEPQMIKVIDIANSVLSLRAFSSHMQEVETFSGGDRTAFDILSIFEFQHNGRIDGSIFWKLDTRELEPDARLAIAGTIAARLSEIESSAGPDEGGAILEDIDEIDEIDEIDDDAFPLLVEGSDLEEVD